jgi:AcrR family transcriptional regulator
MRRTVASGRPRSDSERTRERLLDAAERLFAAHGIQAVSLRAVNAAAGASNVSAAHYHFGSKDGLVRALVARSMEAIARERLVDLDAVEAAAGTEPPELRALVEAMVLPFLRLLRGHRDAVFFLARVSAESALTLDDLTPPAFWAMARRFAAHLRRVLPHLSERARLVRVRFLFQQTFVALTDVQRRARSGGAEAERQALETTVAELVDYLVGGLAAPSRSAPARAPASPRGGHDAIVPRDVPARRPRRRGERAGARRVSVG